MIQVFQYPHETLMQISTEWKTEDSIEGYDDIEKFEKLANELTAIFEGKAISPYRLDSSMLE